MYLWHVWCDWAFQAQKYTDKISVGHETFREKKKFHENSFVKIKKKKIVAKKVILAHILAKETSFRENILAKKYVFLNLFYFRENVICQH